MHWFLHADVDMIVNLRGCCDALGLNAEKGAAPPAPGCPPVAAIAPMARSGLAK